MHAAAMVVSVYWIEIVDNTLYKKSILRKNESFANRHAYCNELSVTINKTLIVSNDYVIFPQERALHCMAVPQLNQRKEHLELYVHIIAISFLNPINQ